MTDFSKIRGFNYQPSYGSSSFENWLFYRPEIVELELQRGKFYFPNFNTVRIWLDMHAWTRDTEKFEKNFENTLRIADSLKIKVIPVLLNRWHADPLDNGGEYIDCFYPGASHVNQPYLMEKYVEHIVGAHKNDERIIAWDIANEPFSYTTEIANLGMIEEYEFQWLAGISRQIREMKADAPAGISLRPDDGRAGIERVEPICDVLMIHPYYWPAVDNPEDREKFEKFLDMYVEVSEKSSKQLIATETLWGSMVNEWRLNNIHYTMPELAKRNIGIIAHALHYSRVADLHDPCDGPVGWKEPMDFSNIHMEMSPYPGNMCFIKKDGTLREGHEAFNLY
ncbi:MAG: hypothetical protein Q4D16_01015 [Eubacteriales bacterium]|nr:hypothetical protein [Eubacteriales bacterium]